MAFFILGIVASVAASPAETLGQDGIERQIGECRRTSFTFQFQLHSGEPLAGKEVAIRQIAHEFAWGWSALPERSAHSQTEFDRATLQAYLDEYGKIFNCVFLGDWQDPKAMARFVAMAESQGMKVYARVPSGLPRKATLLDAVKPFAGHVAAWEVVHEPLGAGVRPQETVSLCHLAKGADPDAETLITQPALGQPGVVGKFRDYLQVSLDLGAPFDAVGIEPAPEFAWSDPAEIESSLEILAGLSRPVYVIGMPPDRAGDLCPLLFWHSQVAGIVCSESQGQSASSLESMRRLIEDQWTTNVSLTTDDQGKVSFEGFYGDYEATLDGHVWKVRCSKGGPGTFTLPKPPTVEPPRAFEMPFTATGGAEAQQWQKRIRARLFEIVEAQNPRKRLPLDVQLGKSIELPTHTIQDLTFVANEGQRIEATLTTPRGKGPFPAMVCLHGHGGDRFMVHDPDSIYHGFAGVLARHGFVTIAPSLSHYPYAPNQLWNLMRLVDILETVPAVDKQRIGVAGLSMGGEWTMWLAAMDLRVRAAVVSGWMCSTEGVLSIHNCPCWMPSGLLELCDIAEVHILIAPRPLLLESAISDECFPIRYTNEGYWKVLRGYAALGAPLNVRQHTFPGGHAWNGSIAYDFLAEALGVCAGR